MGLVEGAVIMALVLLAGSCGSISDKAQDPTDESVLSSEYVEDSRDPVPGGTVVWGVEAETEGLDPTSGRFAVSGQMVASSIFDPLAALDEDGEVQPYLAESIEPNDDFTVWRIRIRPNVKYHDGTTMTAAHVVTVLNAYRSAAITSKAVFDLESVEEVGPLEIKVQMKQPWASFPYVLTTQTGYMPAPSMLTREGADNPIGTGPFKMQEWKKNKSFRAVKNPDYWQEGKPYLDSIEFRPIPDARQRAEDLISGDLDAIITARGLDIDRLHSRSGLKTLTYTEGEETYVLLNTDVVPFDNLAARRAVSLATDRDRIVDEIQGGNSGVATGLFAPGQLGHREDNGHLDFDLERAKEEVAKYTAQTGRELSFEYMAGEDFDAQALSQLLKEMWEAAGAKVKITAVTQDDQVVRAVLGSYEAIQFRLFGHRDPDGDHVWFHSRSIATPPGDPISLNMAQYRNNTIDQALDLARGTSDQAVRDDAYATVERELNENATYVWLYRVAWVIASRDDVHGYGQAANGSLQTLGAKVWIADLWRG
jgi:peptide/nickel transport system substrate-binding protein